MTHFAVVVPALVALYLPFCARVVTHVTPVSSDTIRSLWNDPGDVAERDLFYGPWGPERAPDPIAVYTLIERKHTGVNPGMTVRDPLGREWSVKQAPPEGQPEGPIEVVVSRVLSGVGYHQPPVYFLPTFTLADDWGTQIVGGGRFRLKDPSLKDRGAWSWQHSPLIGTQPYQGLLVILMLLNASDLKNSNNTLYEHRVGDCVEHWFVVRDLGTALGTTGRFAPLRGDASAFRRDRFMTGIRDGFVEFDYDGWHQELIRQRITPAEVRWAARLLGRLERYQWHDAFHAGGFSPEVAASMIQTIHIRMADAALVGDIGTDGAREEEK